MEANQISKLKPCPMCGFSNTEVIKGKIDYQAHCPACLMQGPDRSTEVYAIRSWNSIPRRSEVLELLRLVDECQKTDTQQFHNALFSKVWDYAQKLKKEMTDE